MDNSLLYNFLDNNFTTFQPVKASKITLNLPLGDVNLDWADSISSSGTPIVKKEDSPSFIRNNPEYISSYGNSTNTSSSSLSFKELIELEKIPVRITSGYRNTRTTSGHKSHHSEKDSKGNPRAYDITPTSGHTFEDLRKIFYGNPRVRGWFQANGMGILEEMMDGKNRGFYDTEGKFHYTGATGPHFHIGPDRSAVKLYNSKILKGLLGFKIPYTIFKPVEVEEIDNPTIDFISTPKTEFTSKALSTTTQNLDSSLSFIRNNPEYISSISSTSTNSNLKPSSSSAILFFKSKGLTEEQARGIVGNLMQESGLNPTAVGDKGKSFGLAQWNGTRLQGLINFANKKGTSKDDLNTLLEYIWEELNSSEKVALRALKSSSNIKQATTTFMKYYEKPSNPKLEKRIQFAETL